jgi:hypothetical protein
VNDLIVWLRGVLDEDERIARGTMWEGSGNTAEWSLSASATVWTGGDEFYASDRNLAEYIAYHDPAAVLADIAAKRLLLEWYETAVDLRNGRSSLVLGFDALAEGAVNGYESAIRAIAQAYQSRPGWREEWMKA